MITKEMLLKMTARAIEGNPTFKDKKKSVVGAIWAFKGKSLPKNPNLFLALGYNLFRTMEANSKLKPSKENGVWVDVDAEERNKVKP